MPGDCGRKGIFPGGMLFGCPLGPLPRWMELGRWVGRAAGLWKNREYVPRIDRLYPQDEAGSRLSNSISRGTQITSCF